MNGLWPLGGSKVVVQAWARDVAPATVLATPDDYWTAPYFDWVLLDVDTREVTPLRGIERGAAGYALLRMSVGGTAYIQQYGFPNGTDIGQNVELFAVHADATTEKVASTRNGDFRFMSRVQTRSGAAD